MARSSPYSTGELTDSIFLVLLCTVEPIHGYALMKQVGELTGGEVELGPATMYTTLAKLLSASWIEEIAGADDTKSEKSRKEYRITAAGRKVLQKNLLSRQRLVAVATEILKVV